MSKVITCLLSLLTFFLSVNVSVASNLFDPTNESDSLILVAFYDAMNGAGWTDNANWKTGAVDTWSGVEVTDGRVSSVIFDEANNMVGTLPPEMANLEGLRRLHISNNELLAFPTWVMGMTFLEELVLKNSKLTGPLPSSFGFLLGLRILDLSDNDLTGPLPGNPSMLGSIVFLDLSGNQLTGLIPRFSAIGYEESMIDLSDNLFTQMAQISYYSSQITVHVENNFLTFEDLEQNPNNITFSQFHYSPQYKVAIPDSSINLIETQSTDISLPVGGRYNIYQWYKDGVAITGATRRALHINSVSQSDAGAYELRVTNLLATNLTLTTETLTVTVTPAVDNDGDGSSEVLDCDDSDASIFPGAPELCDGKDNNCDGIFDEGCDIPQLLGLATTGGPLNTGTIFSFNETGTGAVRRLHTFSTPLQFLGTFLQLPDGSKVVIATGKNSPNATVIKVSPNGTSQDLFSFDGTSLSPQSLLTLGSNGRIYGTTYEGGDFDEGVIFSIAQDGTDFSVLHHFDQNSGSYPVNGLTAGPGGAIYGTTTRYAVGSASGTIFKINEDGSAYTTLHLLDYPAGSPSNVLLVGNDNVLYGTTPNGGDYGAGVIYRINPDGSDFNILRHLTWEEGSNPNGPLIQGQDGMLYGTTIYGGLEYGVLFKINTDGSDFSTFFSFDGSNGQTPYGIAQGADGTIYGTTETGGPNSTGTVFKINTDGTGHTILLNFAPQFGILLADDGLLYGLMSSEDVNPLTLFSMATDGSNFTELAGFGTNEGENPTGSLVRTADGSIWGTTNIGGIQSSGVLFKVDPDGANYSVKHYFDPSEGTRPYSGPIQGLDGALYGTTAISGSGHGTIYKINSDGTSYTTLFTFNQTNGAAPTSKLVQASDGTLFGVTRQGNPNHRGVIFTIKPDGTGFSVLHQFGVNGPYPSGSLLIAADGMLYGVSGGNGSNDYGTVYRIKQDGTDFQVLYTFTGATGHTPVGSLVQRSDGKLYGASSTTIFSINPDGSSFTTLFSGIVNSSSPILVNNNSLWGIIGGYPGGVYKFDLTTNAFTSVSLSSTTGTEPLMASLLLVDENPTVLPPPTPTVASSNLTFSDVLSTSATVNFTPGNGTQRLAVIKAGGAPTFVPINDTSYTGDLGNGEHVVYAGSANTFTIQGLSPSTQYYVTIYEFNADGALVSYQTGSAATASHSTLALPNVYLLTPANGALNLRIRLTTTARAVTGATDYTIVLSTSPDFSTGVRSMTGARSQIFDALEYNATYYAKVKTNLRDDYGMVTTFSTVGPEFYAYVTSPANTGININSNVNITASNVVGASLYTIELSETPDFSVVAFEVSGATRTLAFTGLKYNTLYYNRVKTDLGPTPGEVRSFQTRTASSISYVTNPADNSTDKNTTLNLVANNVPGATTYTIQLSEAADFSTIEFEQSGNSRTLQFSGLKYETRYYNRVTTDLSGTPGEVRNFVTIGASAFQYITSPADGATNVNYSTNVTARAVPGATSYTIELNTEPDFTGTSITKMGATRTMGFLLSYDQTYYARVSTDLSATWGAVKSFTTGNPVILAYVTSPVDNGTGVPTTVNVSSNPVAGATQYTIELNTAIDFTGVSFVKSAASRTMKFTGLTEGTIYYTRVRSSLSMDWGSTRKFTTVTSSPGGRIASDWEGEDAEEVKVENFSVKLYPVPFRDKLTLLIETPGHENADVQIFDLNGKEVYRANTVTNKTIDIEKPMVAGMYLIQVKTREQMKTLKILKMD